MTQKNDHPSISTFTPPKKVKLTFLGVGPFLDPFFPGLAGSDHSDHHQNSVHSKCYIFNKNNQKCPFLTKLKKAEKKVFLETKMAQKRSLFFFGFEKGVPKLAVFLTSEKVMFSTF